MTYPISIDSITSDVDFFPEVVSLVEESKTYLEKHQWCTKIKQGWLFTNVGRVLCIFLFELENSQSPEDNLIWLIAGDFPPMYLDTYNVSDTKEVIEVYIELANDWIKQVETNQSLDECFPFEAAPSIVSAEILKKRIVLLQKKFLPEITALSYKSVLG